MELESSYDLPDEINLDNKIYQGVKYIGIARRIKDTSKYVCLAIIGECLVLVQIRFDCPLLWEGDQE